MKANKILKFMSDHEELIHLAIGAANLAIGLGVWKEKIERHAFDGGIVCTRLAVEQTHPGIVDWPTVFDVEDPFKKTKSS